MIRYLNDLDSSSVLILPLRNDSLLYNPFYKRQMESTTSPSEGCSFPPSVERFLCKTFVIGSCILLPIIALAFALGFVHLSAMILEDVWNSKCLNATKQSVREASNLLLQNLKARSSSRENEILANMRELEASLAHTAALLLELKAKVCCARPLRSMSCLLFMTILVPVCI